jgi:hypothetical protein
MRTHAEWKVMTHMALARAARRALDPLAHLGGGLVGEGDREDLTRAAPLARPEQVGDALGQHPGLARAGAGDDEQRRPLVEHAARAAAG